MSMLERLRRATHAYTGTKACGCRVAAVVDTSDNDTARAVSEFIRDGYSVQRVPISEAILMSCTHEREQEAAGQVSLFGG